MSMRNAATPYSPADEAREDYETAMAVHDAQVAARALREAADAWTQGQWARLVPPRGVIAQAQTLGDWLRERADQAERGDLS